MNFKRLRGIAAVAFTTIAAALLAGCMNSMAGSVDSSSRMATLQLSATGIPDEYAKEFAAYCEKQQRAASRSILPNDPYDIGNIGVTPADGSENQSKDLVLVLTGKSETGMTYGPKEVTLDTGTTVDGKTVYGFNEKIAMESMSWALVLTAYKNYNDATKTGDAVLRGYCSVDLRNGSGTATFVMGIAGLTTPGSVDISGTIVDDQKIVKAYTAGIYRKDNFKDIGGTEESVTNFDIDAGNTFTFTANGKDVAPGTYLYIMKFYSDTTKKNIIGSFADTIVINPGNKLTKGGLEIDVIQKVPTEPQNLKAYLMKGLESSDGTYNVKVTWEQADYVTNYELNVVELKENGDLSDLNAPNVGAAIADGQIYGMASMDDTTPNKVVKDFLGSDVFGTGSSSMMYGDTSCVLKLETGKVYEIQLRARNYIGTSKWVDRVAGDSGLTGLTAYDAPNNQRINRLRIIYNLNNGKLVLAGTPADPGTYVKYESWKENSALLDIKPVNEAGTNDNTLQLNGGAEFDAWLLEDGTAVKDLANDTSVTTTVGDKVKGYTYKNVTVTASFGNRLSANVSQEEEMQDIVRSEITVAYTLGDGTTPDISETNGKYEVRRTTDDKANTITITLANAGTDFTDDATKYKNVKFEYWTDNISNKRTIEQSATGKCMIDLTYVTGGSVLSVMVTADTKTIKGASQTLIFNLK